MEFNPIEALFGREKGETRVRPGVRGKRYMELLQEAHDQGMARESVEALGQTEPSRSLSYEGEVSPNRYTNLKQYKRGAHSLIYTADDTETGRIVAVKKHLDYMPETSDPEAIREAENRFKRETQVLAKLNHPGIVDAYGYFFKEEDGVKMPHLVMELVEGESLDGKLRRGELFNEQDARNLVLSVGTPVDYLHNVNGRPILYKDLKPGNIILTPEGAWPHKIVDFSESGIGNATMSGSVMGTVGYNAPELYGGRIADRSVDFYALLKVASHLLIGDNRKFMQMYFDNLTLRQLREDGDLNVSDEFLKVAERATARNPDDRYQDFVEIAKDLGYDIEHTPKTRQELEGILQGRGSLPVQVSSSNSNAVARDGGEKFYDAIERLRTPVSNEGEIVTKEVRERRNREIRDYVAQEAEKDLVVHEIVEKRGLGNVVRDIKKNYRGKEQVRKLIATSQITGSYNDCFANYFTCAYTEMGIGILSIPLAILVSPAAYPWGISKSHEAKKKISNLDSWLDEAGVFPEEQEQTVVVPANANDLEGRVGDIELEWEETKKIEEKAEKYGFGVAGSCATAGGIIYAIVGRDYGFLFSAGLIGLGLGGALGMIPGSLTYELSNKYLTRKALNEKRIARGEAPEKGYFGKAVEWVDDRTLRKNWEGKVSQENIVYSDLEQVMDEFGIEGHLSLRPYFSFYDGKSFRIRHNIKGGKLFIEAKTQPQADELAERIKSVSQSQEQLPSNPEKSSQDFIPNEASIYGGII